MFGGRRFVGILTKLRAPSQALTEATSVDARQLLNVHGKDCLNSACICCQCVEYRTASTGREESTLTCIHRKLLWYPETLPPRISPTISSGLVSIPFVGGGSYRGCRLFALRSGQSLIGTCSRIISTPFDIAVECPLFSTHNFADFATESQRRRSIVYHDLKVSIKALKICRLSMILSMSSQSSVTKPGFTALSYKMPSRVSDDMASPAFGAQKKLTSNLRERDAQVTTHCLEPLTDSSTLINTHTVTSRPSLVASMKVFKSRTFSTD